MKEFMDRNDWPLTKEANVRIWPKTTEFDRPVWMMGVRGRVVRFGRTRVHVELGGTGGQVESFRPFDLEVLPGVDADAH